MDALSWENCGPGITVFLIMILVVDALEAVYLGARVPARTASVRALPLVRNLNQEPVNPMSYFKSLSFLCVLALPVALLGCAGADEPQDDLENVGEAESALCTDALTESPSVYQTDPLIVGDVSGNVTFQSSSSTYGSVACSGRFVTEATSTNGSYTLKAYATYKGSTNVTTSAGACTSSSPRIDAIFYGWNPSTSAWVTLGTSGAVSPTFTPAITGPFINIPASCDAITSITVPTGTYSRCASPPRLTTWAFPTSPPRSKEASTAPIDEAQG